MAAKKTCRNSPTKTYGKKSCIPEMLSSDFTRCLLSVSLYRLKDLPENKIPQFSSFVNLKKRPNPSLSDQLKATIFLLIR